MINDVTELAENKLLLLYILNKIDMPISNSHITQIVLENNLINYFSLQQYLSELIASELILDKKENKRHILSLTSKGKNALDFFISRVPEKKKEIIDTYVDKNISNIKREFEVVWELESLINKKFIVDLKLKRKDDLLIEIKLPADTNTRANEIYSLWKDNNEEIYDTILKLFDRRD